MRSLEESVSVASGSAPVRTAAAVLIAFVLAAAVAPAARADNAAAAPTVSTAALPDSARGTVPSASPPTPAKPASGLPVSPAPAKSGSDLTKTLELGGGLGWYSGDLGHADGEFVRFGISRTYDFGLTFDLGRQARFGETSVGYGVSGTKDFPGDRSISAGISTGTGDLESRYRFDVGASQTLFNVIFTAGYTRIQSKADNRSDGVSFGATRWFAHWIAGASVHRDWGYPGRTTSDGAGVGLTWYQWRKNYVGGGVDFGDVSYQILPGRVIINYHAVGYNVGYSHYFRDDLGVNVRADYGKTSFYESGGVSASVFKEW